MKYEFILTVSYWSVYLCLFALGPAASSDSARLRVPKCPYASVVDVYKRQALNIGNGQRCSKLTNIFVHIILIFYAQMRDLQFLQVN